VSLKQRMLSVFKKYSKLTDYELIRLLGESGDSIRPVRLSLEKNKLIKRTNKKEVMDNGGKFTVYQFIKNTTVDNFKRKKRKSFQSNATGRIINVLDGIVKRLDKLINELN